MKYTLRRPVKKSILISRDDIAVKVNDEFVNLCGYSREEIEEKSLLEISRMIRLDSRICLEDIENEYDCYIFTNNFEPREITISCKKNDYDKTKTYFFKEKSNSRIEKRLTFAAKIISDNEIGGILLRVPDLMILKVNQKFLGTLDAPFNEEGNSIGRRLAEILPEGFCGTIAEEVISNVINNGKSYFSNHHNFELFKRGGKYYDVTYLPIFLSEESRFILHTAVNVTERVLSKKRIEEQKKELEAIIENISDELVICDKNGRYTLMNKEFRDNPLYKITESVTSETLNDLIQHYDYQGKLIEYENFPSKRVIRGERFSGYRMDIKYKDKTISREVSGTPVYDSEGNFLAGVLVSHDISIRLKNEENLWIKTQFELLTQIIENLELGFIRCSYPDYRIIDLNNKAYKDILQNNPELKGYSDINDRYIYDVCHIIEEKELFEVIDDSFVKTRSLYLQMKKMIVAGEERFCRIMWQPMFGLENQIIEVLVIIIDITDEVTAKNKLEETIKTQDDIFANVSHELKTPLNVIFSTAQLLDSYLKYNSLDAVKPKISRCINTIKQNCYRFTKLINNIVDLSKMDSGFLKLNLKNENIVEIIENIVLSVSEYVRVKGLDIIFDTDTEEKIIACDPEKIERIMLNLISNAIKFSNPGGTIYVNASDKGDFFEISVTDTGVGIEKKFLEYIFMRFYQVDKTLARNAEGTGIGLSLVKSIVDMHGGKTSVISETGKGSTFRFELPVRTVGQAIDNESKTAIRNNIDMISIEFSDIYHL